MMTRQACRSLAGRVAFVLLAGLVTARSASAQITVVGSLLTERAAAPGDTYEGAITIRNSTTAIQVATLSLADYRFDAAGSNLFEPPGSHARSSTQWIRLSQQAVSVPPLSTQVVTYTVAVPGGAGPPAGTYWSVVLVEGGSDASAGPSAKFAITPKLRYAVQLVTQVGEAGDCRLSFSEPRVQPTEVVIDIAGRGTRACRPSLRLEVYAADGVLVHTATAQRGLVYPTTSIRQTFTLPPLAPGGYSFIVLADVGSETLQGARFDVRVR